ncbi:hypothetical protein GCM10008939_27970 [Deinococcus aquiradiocola]|uniref:Translocation and assembly module TamB C-terminal domain-containing protein n=1 Tax=Deinococcus aquiradiocola TaxID=393059 RepID=A0A917UST4_9DEIO|nr:hypothetical protein GCM10008939_27970 [Deinococcus aquiradiocola]
MLWTVLGVLLLALLTLLLFGPALFGQRVLGSLGGTTHVTAGRVGGPLWAPTLTDVNVDVPGLTLQAGQAGARLSGVDLLRRTVKLDLKVRDAALNLNLKKLLGGPQGGAAAVNILPGLIDVQNTRLVVDGQGFDVPSGQFAVQSSRAGGQDALSVTGRTTDGPLNVLLKYSTASGAFVGTADIDADARALNHYWHDKQVGGITGGRVRGQYRFGQGPVSGDLTLSGASLAVPGATFVKVTGIGGQVRHRGDLITLGLSGTGWAGPVTAHGRVDLKGHSWDIRASAAPQLSALGKALGQGGRGVARVSAHAFGWNTVTVNADILSPSGEFSVLPFHDLNATYRYFRDTQERRNDLHFQAQTTFQGRQTLSGDWTFNRHGTLAWTGNLLTRPLDLHGVISARNVISAQGSALGGPLRGSLGLGDRAVTLRASPDFYSVSGDLSAQGTLDRLNILLSGGRAGPVNLAGRAVFDRSGLRADLGPLQLNLDRQLRGTWSATDLPVTSVLLSGSGALKVPEASFSGNVRAAVPLLGSQPSGPLTLNWQRRRADWTFAGGTATWRDQTFAVNSSGLSALGYDLRGTLAITTALRASGTLRATGGRGTATLTGLGDHVDVRAVQGGVTVNARTRLTAGFPTSANVQGADVSGTVTVNRGVNFTLNTAGSVARGTLDGQDWTATGNVNLAALRPLVGGNLNGTARLNLAGQGGVIDVAGSGFGASVNGRVTRQSGQLTTVSDVTYRTGTAGQVSARVSGRVYPDLNLAGPVTLAVPSVPAQSLRAQVYGPYGRVQASVNGTLTPLMLGGFTLPAQRVALAGTLTPSPTVSGTYGALSLAYAGGTLRVNGTQALGGYGQSGALTVNGAYGPGWTGRLAASGNLGPYRAAVNGPWTALQTTLSSADGLRASGTLDANTVTYDLSVRGPLAGVYLQGTVSGKGASPRADLLASDGAGGSARVTLRGLQDFTVQANGLRVAGQTLRGNLSAAGGLLSGTLNAGPLRVVARAGRFTASGTLAAHTLLASGRLRLPTTLTGLNVSVDGPQLSVSASGSGTDLRGTVTLKPQAYGGLLSVPAQLLPLQASVTPLRVNLGGLTYTGAWSGQARLRYVYGSQPGAVTLAGRGAALTTVAGGPLSGSVQVLPALNGTLSAPASPLLALLPAQVRAVTVPGRVTATLKAGSADVALLGTRYAGAPLGLQAHVNWSGGLAASGVLTHPGTRVPVTYDGGALAVRGARIDARAVQPFLQGTALTGSVTADLRLPRLSEGFSTALDRGEGRVNLNLTAAGQAARGTLTLSGGTLAADLGSTLGGTALTVRGPLYPAANAVLAYGDLRASLRGDLRTRATLDVNGAYAGRTVSLSAQGGLKPARLDVTGDVAGLNVNVNASGPAVAGAAWSVAGRFAAPDTRALIGSAGTVGGTLGGTFTDLRVNASGRVAGVDFTLPARYRAGTLSVQEASAALAGVASARVSGTVLPALNLSGPVTVSDYLAGGYTLAATGSVGRPDLRLSGVTTGGPRGLDAQGSRVTAHLLGRDWKVEASGEQLSGTARGQLGNTLGPAGLLAARFTLHAPYRSGTQTVQLDGPFGWSQASGFLGDLRLAGNVSGQALQAHVTGSGTLALDAALGQAQVRGTFPASLPLRPGGTLALQTLDLGAFWGRPRQLTLTADASLGGAAWNAVQTSVKGDLLDTAGELSGAVQARYAAGNAALNLAGRRLRGTATLVDGTYHADLGSSGASVARLLPESAGVDALTLAGQVTVDGSTTLGLRQVRASGLQVSGRAAQTGAFTLSGSALYTPSVTQADLQGEVFGGTLSARGSLPEGVEVAVNGMKPAALGIDTLDGTLTLTGPAASPNVTGRLNVTRPEFVAQLDVAGRATDPRLNAAATLRGGYAGRVLAEARNVRLSPPAADVRVYGTAAQGQNRVQLDLNGSWPNLAGRATAQLAALQEPVQVQGDGSGTYRLQAGSLGSGTLKLAGFVPSVLLQAHLTPLGLLGAQGDASADVTVSGPLGSLNVSAGAALNTVTVSGVNVQDVSLAVNGPLTGRGGGLNALTGTLTQAGQATGTLQRGTLTFTDLRAAGYGLTASATGRATLTGTGSAALHLAGAGVTSDLKAAYAGGSIALSGTADAAGFAATLASTGSLRNGWTGTLDVTGGPSGVLTDTAHLVLSGPVVQPMLAGSLGLGGAGVRVVANRQNVQLRLTDGPDAQASGVLNLDLTRSLWEGQVTYARPEASVKVALSGPSGQPVAALDVTRGSWRASGTAGLTGADVNVTDGTATGRVRWDGTQLGVNLPGLSLGGLNISTLAGTLNATGTVNTRTLTGNVTFGLRDLQTGYTVPVVNLPLTGSVAGLATLTDGVLGGNATLTSELGTAALTLAQAGRGGAYRGALQAHLTQPAQTGTVTMPVAGSTGTGTTATGSVPVPGVVRAGGTLDADVTLDARGLNGTLRTQALGLSLGGLRARLNGTVTLTGQSFAVQAAAGSESSNSGTQVSLDGSGGLADLLPGLTALTGVKPTGDGYSLRANLDGLNLQGLKVAPNLSGRVSGDLAVSDGGGTFMLRSPALRLGDTVLAARLDGTLVGDGSLVGRNSLLTSDWRIRGSLGTSSAASSLLTASLSNGILAGTFQMRGLPVDAFLSAFSGVLPGQGLVTGLARFRLPVADPLAGDVNIVAERVTVTSTMLVTPAATTATNGKPATTPPASGSTASGTGAAPQRVVQTLAGSGSVQYGQRELRNIDLHLSGAGRWDVTGQYTRRAVNVTAAFQNTTFTPVLLFIPSLREQSPSLQGTLSVNVAGTYDRPVGNVSGSDLSGALGSISLRIPSLSGTLPDSGLFTVQGRVQAGGSVGADGTVNIGGRLDTLRLRGLNVEYRGLLVPQGLGRIENVVANVTQENAGTTREGYAVNAQAVGGLGVGSLSVQGSLSPRYDLRLTARNFNLPISLIYGRESRINADLTAVEQARPNNDGPILVSGAVGVQSLVLGTGGTGSTAVIPAPSGSTGMAGGGASTGTGTDGSVPYNSPLPEELTTFPRTAEQVAAARRVSPLLSRVVFQNIPITAPNGIRVDESIGRAELSGDLTLSGTGSTPKLAGSVKAIRGSVDLRDNSFNIDSGSAVFDGTSLYPKIAVSATGDVPLPEGGLVGVNLTLDGGFGPQPNGTNALSLDTHLTCVRGCTGASVDLSSANPNAEAQLYSLVAVGTPDVTSLPSNLGTFGTSALKTALNLFVLGELQRNVARALGVDVFKINAALPGENGSSGFGATFTVGSYLTRELYLQYRVDLSGQGLLDATYTTPDNRFTFKASTPLTGLDFSTLQPSFSAAYNFTNRSSVALGVQSGISTKFNFSYVYRW